MIRCIGFVHITLFLLLAQGSYAFNAIGFSLKAKRAGGEIKVDGCLDEIKWQNAGIASGFTEAEQEPNTPSSQRTEVKVLYDDEAIYVGSMMYDTAPDSILSQLREREKLGNTDYFDVGFSCFQDGINAFEFFVTPAGIQLDAQVNVFDEDFSPDIPDNYFDYLNRTVSLPQVNSFSIRVLYFIDYDDLKSGGKFIQN